MTRQAQPLITHAGAVRTQACSAALALQYCTVRNITRPATALVAADVCGWILETARILPIGRMHGRPNGKNENHVSGTYLEKARDKSS